MKKLLIFAVLTFSSLIGLNAQQNPMFAPLPKDQQVRVGVLDNGLTYYIRHNEKPEKQAEFYIYHNVGAMQEEDNQNGLAHFLEHMAFNGTKNLPGNMLIDWLETIGVKFGAELNAFTSNEMTVYNVSNVPVVRESVLDSALMILHDWSYYLTLDAKEVDKERGVILEEKRTRNDAQFRMREKTGKYLYGDTKYSQRNVIGTEEILKNFKHKELVDFYHRWYRTDQQAIIIVGDIDVDSVEAKIKNLFSDIPAVKNPEAKEVIQVPHNEEPIIAVLHDAELRNSSVSVYLKRDAQPLEYNNTLAYQLEKVLDYYVGLIVNERLSDIASMPNAPFINGFSYNGNIVNTMDVTVVGAYARQGESLRAFDAVYNEIEKVARFGFTQSEFDRATEKAKAAIQTEYDRRNDFRNAEFIWTYIDNYRLNTAMLDAEMEYNLFNYIIDNIGLNELNSFVKQARFLPVNQVVLFELAAKDGDPLPSTEDVSNVIEAIRNNPNIEPYKDSAVNEPLIPANVKLKGSKIKTETTDKFDATVWTLKNGATVVVKPTDFKSDEVIMEVFANGGKSILSDDEILTANIISEYYAKAGVGNFNASDLKKQLAGKTVSLYPFVGNYDGGFYGTSTPKDIETLMQLLYLSFTSPRFDESDFDIMVGNIRENYKTAASNPSFIMQDSLYSTLYSNNQRRRIMTYETIDQIDYNKLQNIYKKLFSNAANFTFTIVGNVDIETIKPLVEKYIGSIAKTKNRYELVDDGVRYAAGDILNRFSMPMTAPKTSIMYIMNGQIEYSLENKVALNILAQLLRLRYTETIREEMGATYGVGTSSNAILYPAQYYNLLINLDTDPAMVDQVLEAIKAEIQKIADNGANAEELSKVKEYMYKQHPDQRKQNNYWLGVLTEYHKDGYDMDAEYVQAIDKMTPEYFKELASKIISDGNIMRIIMDPAE